MTGRQLQCEAGQSGLGSEWLQGQRLHCPVDQRAKEGQHKSTSSVRFQYDLLLDKKTKLKTKQDKTKKKKKKKENTLSHCLECIDYKVTNQRVIFTVLKLII